MIKVFIFCRRIFSLLLILALTSCDSDKEADPVSPTPTPTIPLPKITKVDPATGMSGDVITITGEGLTAPNTKVFFSNNWFQLKPDREAEILENKSDIIKVRIPNEPFARDLAIYVKRDDIASNNEKFVFVSKYWKPLVSKVFGTVSFAINEIGYFISSSEVYSFNTVTNQSKQMKNFPKGIFPATAFTWNNKGFVVLNTTPGEIWEYDIELDSWSLRAKGDGISNLADAFSFVIENRVYIGGGQPNSNGNDVFAYDLVNNTWSQVSDFPGIQGNGVSTIVVNGIGYCFGGGIYFSSIGGPPVRNGKWKYDPQLDKWIKLTECPDSDWQADRSFAPILSRDDKIYWGVGSSSNGGIEMNYMYEYSITSNSWKLHSLIPYEYASPGLWFTGFQANGKGYFKQVGNFGFWIFDPTK